MWEKLRRSRWFWALGGAVVAVGIAVPASLVVVSRSQSQMPQSREEHQAIVTEVISSMDRQSLVGSSPTKGNTEAQVILFKFSDFECPYCAVTAIQMKDFVEKHEGDILYVYKHFPLTQIHAEAMPAAKASWAAGQQGQFWLYHYGLFANQDRLGDEFYRELAESMQLDLEQFNRDRHSPEAEAAVQADLELAQELKLTGTPSFIMNDLLIPGGAPPQLFEEIFQQINQFLESQSS
jgi:protein-disulfide isomerase